MKANWDYQDQVHLDQMVLMLVGGEARPHEWWPKVTQGGHQARVHSGQMVLVVVRQGGGIT